MRCSVCIVLSILAPACGIQQTVCSVSSDESSIITHQVAAAAGKKRLGTEEIYKAMPGTDEGCTAVQPCMVIDGDAKSFLAPPSSGYSRDGVQLSAVEDTGDTFPRGKTPVIIGYGLSTNFADAKEIGINTAVQGGTAHNDSHARNALNNGFKYIFPIRDFFVGDGTPAVRGHGHPFDLVEVFEGSASERNALAALFRAYMDVILSNPDQRINKNTVAWQPFGDDSLECFLNTYRPSDKGWRRRPAGTKPQPGWKSYSGAQYRAAYGWMAEVINKYDDPDAVYTRDGTRVPGHVNGRKRGNTEISFGYPFASYANAASRNYVQNLSFFTAQEYWGFDREVQPGDSGDDSARYVPGGGTGCRQFFSLKTKYYRTRQKTLLNAHMPPTANMPARNILPTLYSTDGNASIGRPIIKCPYATNNKEFVVRSYRAQILAYLMGGAHGLHIYQWKFKTDNYLKDGALWVDILTPFETLLEAFLWGAHKGGSQDDPIGGQTTAEVTHGMIRRKPLNGYRWAVQMSGHPDMGGTSATVPPGKYTRNSHGNLTAWWSNDHDDMILWKSFEYRGKMYFVVLNCMPEKVEYEYLVAHRKQNSYWPAALGASNGPVSGQAYFDIHTRFTFPNFGGQLKCTDYFSGEDVPLPANSPFVYDISLSSYEHKVLVFEPADGYCGSGSCPLSPEQ